MMNNGSLRLFDKPDSVEKDYYIVGKSINATRFLDGVYQTVYFGRDVLEQSIEGQTVRFDNLQGARAYAQQQEINDAPKFLSAEMSAISFETPIMKMRAGKIEKIYLRSGFKDTPENYDDYINAIEATGRVPVLRLSQPDLKPTQPESDTEENYNPFLFCTIL